VCVTATHTAYGVSLLTYGVPANVSSAFRGGATLYGCFILDCFVPYFHQCISVWFRRATFVFSSLVVNIIS